MIRHRETKTHSLDEFKEIMMSVWEDKAAFAVMNMTLYLAEYEDDWKGADDLISSLAETEDFRGVIDWWSHLEELEGLLVMNWLERNKICDHCYILEGEKILKSLRKKYPGISRLDDGDQERRIVGFDVLATGFTLTEIGL